MLLPEAVRMALANLWAHRLRSLLTILGVIIGVASVLAIATIGRSFEEGVVSGFDAVDDRTIFVSVDDDGDVSQGPPDAAGLGRIFSDRDVQEILGLEGVETVIVQAMQPIAGFRLEGEFVSFAQLNTAEPGSDLVSDLAGGYHDGRVFNEGQREVVLAYDVAQRFGNGTPLPVGTSLDVLFLDGGEEQVTVVGILAEEENPFVQFTAGQVFAPIDRYYSFPRQESPVTGQPVRVYDGLAVIADGPAGLEATAERVESYLASPGSDAAAFLVPDTVVLVATAGDITAQIGRVFDQISVFVGAIGGVSLLVGAIGIANIMLVSVTERTREIGVMKAVGARDRDVLFLFLLESIVIGVLGALIGIALGLLGAYGLVTSGFLGEGVPFRVPADWVTLALAVGIGVGILAGYWPARRATRVEVVQALAYE